MLMRRVRKTGCRAFLLRLDARLDAEHGDSAKTPNPPFLARFSAQERTGFRHPKRGQAVIYHGRLGIVVGVGPVNAQILFPAGGRTVAPRGNLVALNSKED